MGEVTSPVNPNLRQQLVRIRARRSLGLAAFGGAIALMILFVVVFRPQNPMLLIVFPMLGTPVLLSALSSECPRCAKPFFGAPLRVFFSDSCAHCDLGLKGA